MELKKTLALVTAVAIVSGGSVYMIDKPIEVTMQREVKVNTPLELEVRRFSGYLNFVRPDGHGVLVPEDLLEQYFEEELFNEWEREIRDAVKVAHENDNKLKRTTKITIE